MGFDFSQGGLYIPMLVGELISTETCKPSRVSSVMEHACISHLDSIVRDLSLILIVQTLISQIQKSTSHSSLGNGQSLHTYCYSMPTPAGLFLQWIQRLSCSKGNMSHPPILVFQPELLFPIWFHLASLDQFSFCRISCCLSKWFDLVIVFLDCRFLRCGSNVTMGALWFDPYLAW